MMAQKRKRLLPEQNKPSSARKPSSGRCPTGDRGDRAITVLPLLRKRSILNLLWRERSLCAEVVKNGHLTSKVVGAVMWVALSVKLGWCHPYLWPVSLYI